MPTSSESVLQQPSRKNPVRGDVEHGASGPPSTFLDSKGIVDRIGTRCDAF